MSYHPDVQSKCDNLVTGHKGGVQKAPPLFCAKIARAVVVLANLSLGVDHVEVRDVDGDVLGIED